MPLRWSSKAYKKPPPAYADGEQTGGDTMSIGSRIKERREALGITQVQLAEQLDVTKGAIGNYETDANSPKASILYKVFDVLKCDANYLFQDEMNSAETKNAPSTRDEALLESFH